MSIVLILPNPVPLTEPMARWLYSVLSVKFVANLLAGSWVSTFAIPVIPREPALEMIQRICGSGHDMACSVFPRRLGNRLRCRSCRRNEFKNPEGRIDCRGI